ncbi:MAG: DUF1493 family protein [Ruminococcus flavefaciens]|nr:DUF1493 family protein [Ruminococcus flavefaciens]
MSITEKVIEIIKKEMDAFIDQNMTITPDMNLATDLHVDSLDLVLIVDDVEEAFNIHIKTEDMTGIRTIADIERKIIALQQEQE